jgi:hypothetical protein
VPSRSLLSWIVRSLERFTACDGKPTFIDAELDAGFPIVVLEHERRLRLKSNRSSREHTGNAFGSGHTNGADRAGLRDVMELDEAGG